MAYTKKYKDPYKDRGGYVDGDKTKPVDADIMNNISETFNSVEDYLEHTIAEDFIEKSGNIDKASLTDAINKKHDHKHNGTSNKEVLDALSASPDGQSLYFNNKPVSSGGGGGGSVNSVNGQYPDAQGNVLLDASDVGAHSNVYPLLDHMNGNYADDKLTLELFDTNGDSMQELEVEIKGGSGELPSNLVYSADEIEASASVIELDYIDGLDGRNTEAKTMTKTLDGQYVALFTSLITEASTDNPTVSINKDALSSIENEYTGSISHLYYKAILFEAKNEEITLTLVGKHSRYNENTIMLIKTNGSVKSLEHINCISTNDATSATLSYATKGTSLVIGQCMDALQTRTLGTNWNITASNKTVIKELGRIIGSGLMNDAIITKVDNAEDTISASIVKTAGGTGFGNSLIAFKLVGKHSEYGEDKYLTDAEGNKINPKTTAENVELADGQSVASVLEDKVDKETGKGLSTNDYSNADKAKVESIPTDLEETLENKADVDQIVGYTQVFKGNLTPLKNYQYKKTHEGKYKVKSVSKTDDNYNYYIVEAPLSVSVPEDAKFHHEIKTGRIVPIAKDGSIIGLDDTFAVDSINMLIKDLHGYHPNNEAFIVPKGTNKILVNIVIRKTESDLDHVEFYTDLIAEKVEQIEEEVDQLNKSLVAQGFGENGGGKNLFDLSKWTSAFCYIDDIIEAGKPYTISLNLSDSGSYGGSYIYLRYTTDNGSNWTNECVFTQARLWNKTYTFTPVSGRKYALWRNSASDMALFDKAQIEQGNTATAYEPYILSNKQLTEQNKSLDAYGLLNKFDGQLLQGYYNSTDGTLTSNNTFVATKNKLSVKAGGKITVKTKGTNNFLATYYSTSGAFMSNSESINNSNEAVFNVPSGCGFVNINIGGGGVNHLIADMQGTISIFIDNAIDQLNADLSVVKGHINGTLFVKQYGKLVVINGYMQNLSITADGLKIGTIPSGINKPTEDVRAVCNVGSNAWSSNAQGYFTVGTNGEIWVKTKTGTETTFYVSCSYIVG